MASSILPRQSRLLSRLVQFLYQNLVVRGDNQQIMIMEQLHMPCAPFMSDVNGSHANSQVNSVGWP